MDLEKISVQAEKIIHGGESRREKLMRICELLDREIERFDWTGFYLVAEREDRMLELGPYVGEATEHTRIPFGTGICGQAAETCGTIVVQDVSRADNYLACSPRVRSEIVVPIMKDGRIVGELDIDSHKKNAITPGLKTFCEELCGKLSLLF